MKLYTRTLRGKKASYSEATLAEMFTALISRVRYVYGAKTADHLNNLLFMLVTKPREYGNEREEPDGDESSPPPSDNAPL